MTRRLMLSYITSLAAYLFADGQSIQPNTSAQLFQSLSRLNVLGRVLYIGAHPDDENNQLIAYLANGALLDVAYLSLTRGEGGQNLVGDEQGDLLGILRVQESLAARQLDGASVFFTRARDFGYSKTAEETLSKWGKDSVLADIVWVIRSYRPDVIISRFPSDAPHDHGHHTASGQLAREAFFAAADPNRFPEQLTEVKVWQAKRLLWNVYNRFGVKGSEGEVPVDSGYLAVDVGGYNALLGMTYTQLGAGSRVLHHSQAMGAAAVRGSCIEYFRHEVGAKAVYGLLDGVDTSWKRSAAGNVIALRLKKILAAYNFSDPASSVPALAELGVRLSNYPDDPWSRAKRKEIEELVCRLLGLSIRLTTESSTLVPGERFWVTLEALNPSSLPVTLDRVRVYPGSVDTVLKRVLEHNEVKPTTFALQLNDDTPYSEPYWLREGSDSGMYRIRSAQLKEETASRASSGIYGELFLRIHGYVFSIAVPIQVVTVDPRVGEELNPVAVASAVSVELDKPVYTFVSSASKPLEVKVRALTAIDKGSVRLQLGEGWRSLPDTIIIPSLLKGESRNVTFWVTPPEEQCQTSFTASVTVGRSVYQHQYRVVDYPHIQQQHYFPKAEAKFVRVRLADVRGRIGYVCGAKDRLPDCLREMGYTVAELTPADISVDSLTEYDAIVLGIRSYNVHRQLSDLHQRLLAYAEQGGNVVALYNTSFDLPQSRIGMLPIHLSDRRVVDERAPVSVVNPDHLLLRQPNRITDADFEGWIYDRGIYFPDEWDPRFEALFSTRGDTGEEALAGGVLVADIGKGHFVYTSFSWFRQLPAGIPGAYRIFQNILQFGR